MQKFLFIFSLSKTSIRRGIVLLALIFLFSIPTSNAQNKTSKLEKIATTTKIWGFLKYYHPEAASGKYDWDKELLEMIKKIKRIEDRDSLSLTYFNWINSLGKINTCHKCINPGDYFEKNFDLSWIEKDPNISTRLSNQLRLIEKNRFQGEHHYISYAPAKNFKVINEITYNYNDVPTEEYRLLSLARYWNIIEYFYPYKYLNDQNWNEVLLEMIPEFINANKEDVFKKTIQRVVAKIDDSHAWVTVENVDNIKYSPFKVKHIDNHCVISGYYNKELTENQGLRIGDVILKVNGEELSVKLKKELPYTTGSNLVSKRSKVYAKSLNTKKDFLTLSIKRGDSIFDVTTKTYAFKKFEYYNSKIHKPWKILEDNIGYINLRLISSKESLKTMKKFIKKDVDGIILDLRGYPKLVFKQISKFLNSEKREYASILNPDLSYPGKFVWSNIQTTGSKNRKAFKGKVIVIVDEQSISLSEFAAMCLQTGDNVMVVGSQTSGADGNVSMFRFAHGFKTAISGKGVYYPNGDLSQRKGVKIDVHVTPTIDGLMKGKDEVLEEALKQVRKK